MIVTNSRIITPPDIIQPDNNHVVLLINATTTDAEHIAMFCKVSSKNYDVYLYRQGIDDSDWFESVKVFADQILITESTATETLDSRAISFGPTCEINSPLDYFQTYDTK